ncbi:hypothetical protein KSS87_006137 [Heliosperma pusillum]|nr:hypothetical protein KSS87_006137 [Heliosperma pusillum]
MLEGGPNGVQCAFMVFCYATLLMRWSGQPGKMPWTFEGEETMYLLEGKVKVSVDGHEGSFEIGAGDLAVFPKGMKITWDVLEAVNKHYYFKKIDVTTKQIQCLEESTAPAASGRLRPASDEHNLTNRCNIQQKLWHPMQ